MTMHKSTIHIRPLTLDDTTALYNYVQENRQFLTPYEPIREAAYYTKQAQQQKIATEIAHWREDRAYSFGIFLGEQLIGRVNLSNITRGAWQNCTIGYSIAERQQGNGYMTTAVQQAVGFAFDTAQLHRVQAGIMPRNKGSIRVLAKVGFLHEGLSKYHLQINGVWEDHEIYAVTREMWEKDLDNNN